MADKDKKPKIFILDQRPGQVMDFIRQVWAASAREPVNPLAVNTYHTHNGPNHQISELLHVVELPRGVEEGDVTLETRESYVIVTAKRKPLVEEPQGNFCPDVRRGIADTFQAGLPAYPNVTKGDLKVAFDKAGTMTVRIDVPESAQENNAPRPATPKPGLLN